MGNLDNPATVAASWTATRTCHRSPTSSRRRWPSSWRPTSLKGVERRNRLADGTRRENTAEHSWHLGIAALVLAPFASEPVDVATAVAMALVHDIVEIDAGDTFAYDDAEGAATKRGPRGGRRRSTVRLAAAPTGRRFRETVGRVRTRRHTRGALRDGGRSVWRR